MDQLASSTRKTPLSTIMDQLASPTNFPKQAAFVQSSTIMDQLASADFPKQATLVHFHRCPRRHGLPCTANCLSRLLS
ncbi:unnamed protein product [Linum trigynum]|uniref:Uncharacterized protein n=1 Tax=Linum trigynum TaxID=586398 RepID=A0AAV2FBR7_9ROSI